MDYTDWQQRVADEEKELSNKIDKLGSFLNNDNLTKNVAHDDICMLQMQHDSMKVYANILRMRIRKF